ncbi:MAG: ATP-dependent metallopeptidase FtsH/Yme1/Tma family protein [Deltaproteobacteria bacterium]|nr:ATP-dependent metallopeptidase FtsH/Yme1/Tma family protein [Deltaproteobacteria bacterium]
MKYSLRNFLILLIISAVIIVGFNFWKAEEKLPYIDYSTFIAQLSEDEITKVTIEGSKITATDKFDRQYQTFTPDVKSILERLEQKKIVITTRPFSDSSPFFFSPFLLILVLGGWMYFLMQQQKGGGFTKNKSKLTPEIKQHVTFEDVAGIPEAKEELVETVEFLKHSSKFMRLGGRIPKGVLLQGPPGTGKTLLAKAIAGEAGVPFYSMSGSDFVEMFVGVGASRVRNLFEQAKKNAPCIIFIDEIDAVGRSRGAAGAQGGQDEREQTLNALLVEMDGFKSGETVIIVAATNRPDVLDPALLRPGRFDRQVNILPPDVKGREKILEVHAQKLIMSKEVQLANVARSTPGFTGAELANLMNESALMAARRNKDFIETTDIEEAKDKILMGAERKGMVISHQERKVTAYHEAGHAIVAHLLPESDPVHKITIIPRGRALGLTQQLPLDDRHSYSREYLRSRVMTLLGGRTAEEIVFNQFTTGASNDLQSATEIATRMVCEWGMSDLLGPRAYVIADQSFLQTGAVKRTYSEETAKAIDQEINKIIEDCYQETMIILEGKIAYLHKLAEILLEAETIDAEEVNIILKCKEVNKLNEEMLRNRKRELHAT